jgi:hypothetical protein
VIRAACLLHSADIQVSLPDRKILQKLAAAYQEFLILPEEQEKQHLQRCKNALDWVRPIVICFPEVSWREIIPASELQCEGSLARQWENQLRQNIFTAMMGSDECLRPGFSLGYFHTDLNWGAAMQQEGDLAHGSYRWESPLHTPDDIDKVQPPVMEVDFAGSEQAFHVAEDIFQGILPVIRQEAWFWTTGLTMTFIHLRGLEQMMFDMVDHPDFVHALMAKLRDGTLQFLNELEQKQLLFPNWGIHYCGSGGIGLTDLLPAPDFEGVVRLKDQWGFSESQETVGVSPGMFNQFILPYQLPILEKFGLTYYGCCEPVDRRWRYLSKISNLRRVSVSPWSDREKMAENLGADYVYVYKPNPAFLAFPHLPENEIRANIRETLEITAGCHLEIILKDVTTVMNDPSRINRWIQIVKEEIFR